MSSLTTPQPTAPQLSGWHVELRKVLSSYFAENELETLCFDLRFDYESLGGQGKSAKVVELITAFAHMGRITELIDYCSQLRPNVPWAELREAALRDPELVKRRPDVPPPIRAQQLRGAEPSKRPKLLLLFIVVVALVAVAAVLCILRPSPPFPPSKSTPTPTRPATPTHTATSIPPTVMPPTMTPVPLPAPDKAVRDYYLDISARQYVATWTRLTPHFKEKHNPGTATDPSGFAGYKAWWDSVATVYMGDITVLSQTASSALVFADLTYTLGTGELRPEARPYIELTYDSSSGKWLFYDQRELP